MQVIKQLSLLFFIFVSLTGYSQFTDDFSDGDYTSSPTWTGDDTSFTINGSNELWLNSYPVTDEAYLSTPSTAIYNATWEFYLRMDFNPSSSNKAYVYLTSNQSDLYQNLNGYYVMIGNTADEVSLYEQSGGSSTKIIDGVDGLVNTSSVEIKVQVTRDANGNWELLADTSTGFTGYVSQGTVTDNTHTTSNYFGVLCDFTSTRSDLFFFDDFVVTGSIVPDLTAPTIDSVVATSLTDVDVYFNETVTSATAQTSTNYNINGGVGNPMSATRDATDHSLVHLTLSSSINANQTYTLTVNNVEDTSGNATSNEQGTFFYYQAVVVNYRDIVINEILAKESPSAGLPESEMVELYNASNQAINLDGFTFSDLTSTKTLPAFLLQPNSYVILVSSADTSLWTSYGDVICPSSWPILNNGEEELTLELNGTIIDQVNYSDSWYATSSKADGGWTLEQINPIGGCSGSGNWAESENASGGTPGAQNSVYDTTPEAIAPSIISYEVISSTQVSFTASEQLDTSNTTSITVQISPSLGSTTVSFSDVETVVVDLAPAMVTGVSYTFEINGLSDCIGNTQTTAFTTVIGVGLTPNPFDIIINEIYSVPDDAVFEEEFVEIYNRTDSLISLDNLFFSDASSSVSLPNVQIPANDYAVLIGGTSTGSDPYLNNGVWFIPLSSFPSLNNAGDVISIGNSINGEIINTVSYSEDWYTDADKADGGYSLELINPLDVCAGSSNWREPLVGNHTMGEQNTVYDPYTPDGVSFISVQITGDSTLEITANGQIESDSVFFSISPDLNVDTAYQSDDAGFVYTLITSDAFETGVIYNLTVSGFKDCLGNSVGTQSFTFRLAEETDLVINEVLFDARTGGSDFVEVYNRSDFNIDLKNWSISYVTSSGNPTYKTITDTSLVLKPGDYAAFADDPENVALEYPGSATNRLFTVDLPTYANDAGRVTLVSNLMDTIDDFSYSSEMQFDLLIDFDGISLERINPDRKTNDATNWHSASENVGYATPGYENSQYGYSANNSTEVSINPETFSPDNDSYNDVVNIEFELSDPGYVANIKIYDPNGRLVRNLVSNRILGSSDAVSWDGINDENQKAGIGIYLIYIELYDLSGNVKHFKETCVLATKL